MRSDAVSLVRLTKKLYPPQQGVRPSDGFFHFHGFSVACKKGHESLLLGNSEV
jgi:hypothetical protein